MSASTILVATDFSKMSQVAIEHATTQARMTGAKVLIVHAVGPSPDRLISGSSALRRRR